MNDFETAVLAELAGMRKALERQAAAVEKSVSARVARAVPGELSDEDLDANPANDVQIRKDPPRWKGTERFAGKKMSEATGPYLDELANFLEWKAEANHNEAQTVDDPSKKKTLSNYAGLARTDAKRARAWARRIRSGWKPPEKPPPADWKTSSNGTTSGSDASWKTPAAPASEPKPNSPEDVGFTTPRDDERRDEWDDE